MKFPGVDEELQKILDANLDEAPARRRAREAFKNIQLGIDHILFKTPSVGVAMEESYEKNSRGLEIFSKSWLPFSSRPKAMVYYCHGYGDTCTFFFEGTELFSFCFYFVFFISLVVFVESVISVFQLVVEMDCNKVTLVFDLVIQWLIGVARKLALSGYGVFAMDYPGFGLSEGLHCYIPSFDRLVDDVIEHYSKVKERPEFRTLPSFLFGQSMGGAVALKVHLKQPNAWDGAVLVAPMCKIADNMVPPWLVTQILIGVANFLPKQKLVPQKDLAEAAFRELKKKEQTAYNVVAYKDKPRLRTALVLLRTTQEIEQKLQEVSLPLLILHGKADMVTDPSVSKALYDKARSSDKKLNLYKDAYHSLLEGEPDETIIEVFNDIVSWLDERSIKNTSN